MTAPRVPIGPDGIDENGRPTYGGLRKWQPSQPPAARDAGVGALVDMIALALTWVPMGELRVKAGIALTTLAAAAQPARAVPSRAAVEAALGTITDAARRAVRYYDDDDEQDAAFERIDIASERVLALIYADAPADASEAAS